MLPKLEFRESINGPVLALIRLQPTVFVAEEVPAFDVPDISQFPKAFRPFDWTLQSPLQNRFTKALGRHFHYQPIEGTQLTTFVTEVAPLQLSPQLTEAGIRATIALLISFPYNKADNRYSYHIQTLLREGRELSDETREIRTREIATIADRLVDKIVAEAESDGE